MTIKAIDTTYNGYKFRSRLEARWAVFFDEAAIPYLYESEGFDLDGIWYLPDFFLKEGITFFSEAAPRNNVWVEIKPVSTLTEEERQKIAQFVKKTGNALLLIVGDPHVNADIRLITYSDGKGWSASRVRWIELSSGRVGLVADNVLAQLPEEERRKVLEPGGEATRLQQAYSKGRQARFEHKNNTMKVKKPESVCQSCGRFFTPYRRNHRYCRACYRRQQRTPQPAGSFKPSPYPPASSRHTPQPAVAVTKKSPWFFYLRVSAATLGILIFLAASFAVFRSGSRLFAIQLHPPPSPGATSTLPATYTPAATLTPMPTGTPKPSATPDKVCDCGSNVLDCSSFDTQQEAQACFEFCLPQVGDVHFLDGNQDGIACEALP